MSAIAPVFTRRTAENQLAFMPFITAGDPDLPMTARLIRELSAAGADLIEIGFPYSDPIADGPVIQASYTRALNNKVHVADIFATVAEVTRDITTPLVAMVSYAIIFRIGPDKFVEQAAAAGFAGLIVPDLPGDEADQFAELARTAKLDLIQLIAPTTPGDRAARIMQNSTGFVYCIAVAGTTGVREALPDELQQMLRQLRERTELPLAVGFGISRADQIDGLRGLAQGVIVGSAIVRFLETLATDPTQRDAVLKQVHEFAATLAKTAHESR